MSRQHKFWCWSGHGNAKAENWPLRALDEDWAWDIRVRLRRGTKLRIWPDPPPVFVFKKVKEFTDMPCGMDSFHVVSDRLRKFLEVEAPRSAQYFPIRLQGPRAHELSQPYWAINWIRVFDCLDPQSYNVDDAGTRYVQVEIIDSSRIPGDGVLGLLGGFTVTVLIRNDLKLKLQKAGFTGLWFPRIAHSDGRNFKPFMSVDYSEVPEGEGVRAAMGEAGMKRRRKRKAPK